MMAVSKFQNSPVPYTGKPYRLWIITGIIHVTAVPQSASSTRPFIHLFLCIYQLVWMHFPEVVITLMVVWLSVYTDDHSCYVFNISSLFPGVSPLITIPKTSLFINHNFCNYFSKKSSYTLHYYDSRKTHFRCTIQACVQPTPTHAPPPMLVYPPASAPSLRLFLWENNRSAHNYFCYLLNSPIQQLRQSAARALPASCVCVRGRARVRASEREGQTREH